jgi:DNA-binding response OmpR family regulator
MRSRLALLVGDEGESVSAAKARAELEREGYAVIAAGDARAAIAVLAVVEPRLLVVDLSVDAASGIAFLRQRRRRHLAPRAEVRILRSRSPRDASVALGADLAG